jgi:UDP-glucuronate decarboxylase
MAVHDGRVVSNFIVQALKGEEITVYGDGSQTRSFCYVDDLVEGLVRMMSSPEGFTGPINIGTPQEFTIRQLAETLIRMTGSASPIIFRPLPQDDPIQRRPDITLAHEKLGWEPRIPLSEGLEKTIAYFRTVIR